MGARDVCAAACVTAAAAPRPPRSSDDEARDGGAARPREGADGTDASLRWHYPVQVRGSAAQVGVPIRPLSLVYQAPRRIAANLPKPPRACSPRLAIRDRGVDLDGPWWLGGAMRAIEAVRAGGPDVLRLGERPVHAPGPGEVLVDVACAGVNFIDTYRRSGVYPTPFPHVPGSEGAGTVASVGRDVDDVAPGARVAWVDAPGSYAEHVVVPADRLIPVPDDVDLATATALALQGLTAHYLVDSSHAVGPGEHVLVHAGAGGVGLLLTQLAVARGAQVVTTVSSQAKEDLSREAGAVAVIRYDQIADLTSDLPRAVRAIVPEGVHAVYDGVGLDTFDASLASLRTRGTLVLFGGASGQVPPFDLQRLNTGGSLFVTRPTLSDHIATRTELLRRSTELFTATRAGALVARVGATYPLAEASDAHRALESRSSTGKILLDIRPGASA